MTFVIEYQQSCVVSGKYFPAVSSWRASSSSTTFGPHEDAPPQPSRAPRSHWHRPITPYPSYPAAVEQTNLSCECALEAKWIARRNARESATLESGRYGPGAAAAVPGQLTLPDRARLGRDAVRAGDEAQRRARPARQVSHRVPRAGRPGPPGRVREGLRGWRQRRGGGCRLAGEHGNPWRGI